MTATPLPASEDSFAEVVSLLRAGGVVVLSGAGISTASGIPDYRGPTGRTRTAAPMQWAEFRDSPAGRQRYWARGQVGFRRYADIQPNDAHRAVARLQEAGLVNGVVTQNVDGLHLAAGSPDVVELHGSLDEVVCMVCGRRHPRRDLQTELDEANPWLATLEAPQQADGDALLDDASVARFAMVRCRCGGDYRPDVVFFGEYVPRERMQQARQMVADADAVLVLGSSLTVGSGYLLVRHALRSGARAAIVNTGPTRADHLVATRLNDDLSVVLPRLVALALGRDAP